MQLEKNGLVHQHINILSLKKNVFFFRPFSVYFLMFPYISRQMLKLNALQNQKIYSC